MFDGNEVVFFINVYNQCPDNENIGYIGNEMYPDIYTDQYYLLSRNMKKTTNSSQQTKYFLAI